MRSCDAFPGKLAGHANPKTTQKHYTAADEETTASFTETMNQHHAASEFLNYDVAIKTQDEELVFWFRKANLLSRSCRGE